MTDGFEIHVVEYQHDGKLFVIEVPATSENDLWQRIERMRDGRYMGVLQFSVPTSCGVLAKSICWIQNFFSGRRRANRFG